MGRCAQDLAHSDDDGAGSIRAGTNGVMTTVATGDLLADIGEAIPHIVFVAHERTGALEHLSARFGELTGAHVGDGLGLGYRAFVHPEDLASIERAMRSAIRSRAALRSEARLRDRGGVFRWHEVRATRMRGRGARRWFGTCTDVDDTHRAAQAQRALTGVALALTTARIADEVLTTFARSVVEVLADVCAIDLSDATSCPRRAAIAMATELGPVPLPLAQADRSMTLSSLTPSTIHLGAPPPGLLAPLRPTSVAIAQITVAGRCVGYVVLGTTTRTPAWREGDRAMLDDLVRRLESAPTRGSSRARGMRRRCATSCSPSSRTSCARRSRRSSGGRAWCDPIRRTSSDALAASRSSSAAP
jgi:PAS domain S-box-containing protein